MKNMTDIIWYDTIDSTNTQAKRMLHTLPAISAVAAREQTAGRGQKGNSWKSEPGSNLTFSLVLRFGEGFMGDIPPACQFVISEAVALSVRDLVRSEGIGAMIKWPNDIYAGDRKLCGILIENSVNSGRLTSCIAGVGLNLNQTEFPSDLPNPVSLSLLTGEKYDCRKILERLLRIMDERLRQAYSAPEMLREEYVSSLYRKDEPHRYTDTAAGTEFTGIIRGITGSALLQVELEDGSVRDFNFKEIGYII